MGLLTNRVDVLLKTGGPLGERNFLLFLVGYTSSLVGSRMFPVALAFAVFVRGGGAADVSVLLAAQSLPSVLFLILGGVVADRLSQRLIVVGADILRCASQTTISILLLTDKSTTTELIVLAFLIGVGNSFYSPGRSGLIPRLVKGSQLQSANGMMAIAGSLGDIVGPAMGGVIVGFFGSGIAVLLGAFTYAVSAACSMQISVGSRSEVQLDSFTNDLLEGWNAFRSRAWVWIIVLQSSAFHLIVYGPTIILGASLFSHVQHGAATWGTLLGALGVGSMFGGLSSMRFRPSRPLPFAMIAFSAFGAAPLALAIPFSIISGLIAFFIAGVGLSVYLVLWDTTLQQKIPPHLLARVCSIDMVGSTSLLPAGYMLAAPLSEILGLHGAFWLAATFCLVSSSAVALHPAVRRLQL